MRLDHHAQTAPVGSSIGKIEGDEILVHGRHLVDELMGTLDLGAMMYHLVRGHPPEPHIGRLFNAVLVALVDYGISPMALAARLTFTSAPDSVQGAVAAGVLGVGSRFVGVWEDVGRMLGQEKVEAEIGEAELDAAADRICNQHEASGQPIPGLGHPFHKTTDPRTARIYAIAGETGLLGPYARLIERVGERASARRGRHLVLNPAGACGAVLLDLGFDARILRGLVAVARAAGVVGHLQEEFDRPIGPAVWHMARATVSNAE